jgi:hypothetical protein
MARNTVPRSGVPRGEVRRISHNGRRPARRQSRPHPSRGVRRRCQARFRARDGGRLHNLRGQQLHRRVRRRRRRGFPGSRAEGQPELCRARGREHGLAGDRNALRHRSRNGLGGRRYDGLFLFAASRAACFAVRLGPRVPYPQVRGVVRDFLLCGSTAGCRSLVFSRGERQGRPGPTRCRQHAVRRVEFELQQFEQVALQLELQQFTVLQPVEL